jgi:hypothetical protein
LLVVQATSDQVTVMLQEKSGQINPWLMKAFPLEKTW